MRRRALEALARVSTRHPVAVISAAVLLVLASIYPAWIAVRNIESDFTHLIPRNRRAAPAGNLYLDTLDWFGAADKLYVAIELDSPELADDARGFVEEFGAALLASEHVQSATYRVGQETIDFVRERIGERAYLFLETEDLDLLEKKLSTEAIHAQMKANRAVIPQSMAAFRKLMQSDPLGLADIFVGRATRHGQEFGSGTSDGYFLSRDRTLYGIVVKPASGSRRLFVAEAMLELVEEAERRAWRAFASRAPDSAARLEGKYTRHLTGWYAGAVYNDRVLKRDLRLTFLLSVTGVVLIFAISFRRPGAAPFAGLPLAGAILVTMAVAGVRFGRISMISGCFAAILLGLGIDFAVHIYNRYVMERRKRRTPEDALTISIVRTGGGVFLGGLTTAIAFFGIMVTNFKALSEIGFLAGWGIVLSMLAMTTVLPAMLLLRARVGEKAERFQHLIGYGLGGVSRLIHSHPLKIVVVSVALTVAGTAYLSCTISRDFFNYDFRELGTADDPTLATARLVAEKFDLNLSSELILVSTGATEEEALEGTREAVERLRGPGTKGMLTAYRSVLGKLPAPSSQREAVERLGRIDFDRVEADIRRAAVDRQNGAGLSERGATVLLEDFFKWLAKVRASLEGGGPELITSADFAGTAAADLIEHHLHREPDGSAVRVATYLRPTIERHPRAWYEKLRSRTGCQLPSPDARLCMTAPVLAAYELRDMVFSDFSLITGAVLAGVLLSLLYLFRSPVKALVALAPMAAGVAFTLSIMMLIGHKLNYINVVVLPMIIGVGIDYGIHVLHRYVHGSQVHDVVVETGRAIVVTTLTTMAGFGALMAANMRGIASLGFVASLGVAMCLLTSIIALPAALLRFFPQWRGCEEPECGCGELADGECPVIAEVLYGK